MVVYYDEDNFSIKLYRDCVSGELVDLIEVIPIDELLEVWADRKTEPQYDVDKGTIRCDNCSENGSYKCTKCDGEMHFKRLEDEPQTEIPEYAEWKKSYQKMIDCGEGVI